MATDNNDTNNDEKKDAKAAPTPPTVRLATDEKLRQPKKEGEGFDEVYHTPPAQEGVVNIGTVGTVYLPSLEKQKSGFTPLLVVREKGKDDRLDTNSANEATRLLLENFSGIYKPMTKKG